MEEAGITNHAIMLCTEGLLNIGDKGKDGRYPRVTAAAQVRTASQVYEQMRNAKHLKTVCAWLAGVKEMDAVTADGFERQGWWTHEWDEVFELNGEIPLVQYLIDNPGLGIIGNINPDPPEPEPEDPPMPEPELDWDIPPWNDATVTGTNETGWVWRLVEARIEFNPGDHTTYIDAVDENGQRASVPIFVQNANGNIITKWQDKPPTEPGCNVPMFKWDNLSVWVAEQPASDVVQGLHTRYADNPDYDTTWGHVSYYLRFQRVFVDSEPEPEPLEPTEPLGEFIRRMAWDRMYPAGIDRNPEAAFQRVAFERVMGAPVTNEFRVTHAGVVYAAQGFDAILWTEDGIWDNIRELEWNAL